MAGRDGRPEATAERPTSNFNDAPRSQAEARKLSTSCQRFPRMELLEGFSCSHPIWSTASSRRLSLEHQMHSLMAFGALWPLKIQFDACAADMRGFCCSYSLME